MANPPLKVQKIPAETLDMVRGLVDAELAGAHSAPRTIALAVDVLVRVLIASGELDAATLPPSTSYGRADALLNKLRVEWSDSDTAELLHDRDAARRESAMWKRMHREVLSSWREGLAEFRESFDAIHGEATE